MKPIGGYFELELNQRHKSFPHSDGILLNSGRHALEYILRSLGEIKRLWIPYFTCDVVLQPLNRLNIPYSFYHIDNDFYIDDEIVISKGEYIIYTNYFGLLDSYCISLAARYGQQLIIDNSQALYSEHIEGINTFYSPRKFVGVSDGGIAYINNDFILPLSRDVSYDRCSHLLMRHDLIPSEGYQSYRDNSHKISTSTMSEMSRLTQSILSSVDYEIIREKRINNFIFLHNHLSSVNMLKTTHLDYGACPMVYPFYSKQKNLRQKLISDQIYVAQYWPNVLEWCTPNDIEYMMANYILPLPIDQRYDESDMNRIINCLNI